MLGKCYHTTHRLYGFCFAIQLVAKALDIIQPVGNDDRIPPQYTLDCRVMRCSSIFLRFRFSVNISLQAEGLVIDMVDGKAVSSRICGILDFAIEEINQLLRSKCFAGGGVARYEDQLKKSISFPSSI